MDGSRDGQGVYHYDGHRYEGSWKDGMPHGQDTVYYANTTRFEGEWKNYFTDGDRYIGEFRDGQRHGQGIVYYLDGRRYEGQLQGGEKDGLGVLYGKRGGIARQGRWKDDRLIQRMGSLPDVEN